MSTVQDHGTTIKVRQIDRVGRRRIFMANGRHPRPIYVDGMPHGYFVDLRDAKEAINKIDARWRKRRAQRKARRASR